MRTLVPTVLAAGVMLLSACGQDDPAEAGQDEPAATTSATSTATGGGSTGEDGAQSVDCGEVDVDGGVTHRLIADPATAGTVGCTEAFNVLDAYLAVPAGERGASFEGLDVGNGWSCVTDDGETASIACIKGKNGDNDYDFAFYTKPV